MLSFSPYKMRLFRTISRRLDNYRKNTFDGIEVLWESAFKGGVLGLIVATIVWISIFLYVVFYYLYMPSLSHTRPVNLQFLPCEVEKGACSFPSAHVQLTKKQQLLMIGQRYKIFLSLEMPESPANVDLGMFMVCARMVDKNGVLVSNACRSSMLHYHSPVLRFLFLCVNSPFLVFGYSEEKQNVIIELYSDFEEHQSHTVTDVYVEVQSRFIEFYSAKLQIQAHLTGLRYLMFNWPLLSAIIGISSNLFVITFISSLSWYHLYMQNEHGRNMFFDFIKQSLVTAISSPSIFRRNYVEELPTNTNPEVQTESSSESEEAKLEWFKPGTSEELSSYLESED